MYNYIIINPRLAVATMYMEASWAENLVKNMWNKWVPEINHMLISSELQRKYLEMKCSRKH